MWVFFRDDDLGFEPKSFSRLLKLFIEHGQRLNAAAVPFLLSEKVISESIPFRDQAAHSLQIVTHGFRHESYQREGKKAEFGSDRSEGEVRQELREGRKLLEEKFQNYFPCFVPPWNRIADAFLPLLEEAGYKMLSREVNVAQKSARASILECNVTLDLHTAKGQPKRNSKEIFHFLQEKNRLGEDHVGIMLHHARMSEEDFQTMDELLKELSKRNIQTVFFSDMLPGFERRAESRSDHV